MYTVEEVSDELSISKVTVYAKLKKFSDMVVEKQGKKYITDELLKVIKNDLKAKNWQDSDVHKTNNINSQEVMDLNKDVTKMLMDQLEEKDTQLKEKDLQIERLHKLLEDSQKLVENNQILLKQAQDKEIKLLDEKKKLEEEIETQDVVVEELNKKKGFFNKLFGR